MKTDSKPWKKYGQDIVNKLLDKAKGLAKNLRKGDTMVNAIERIDGWILQKLDGVFA